MDLILTREEVHSVGLLDIPNEIVLQILCELGLDDIISIRKTCTRLHGLTQDRLAWLHILRMQSRTLPFPPHITSPDSWIFLSSEELESTVRRLHAVQQTWLLPRSHYFTPSHSKACVVDPTFNNDDGARTIYSIDVFLDRWLLCIYHEKMVELWDLDTVSSAPHEPIMCISQKIQGAGSFSSAITYLNDTDNVLTIAISCHELCHVLQVQLRESSAIYSSGEDKFLHDSQFRTIATISFASPIFCLRAVDPNQSLLLLGLPSTFHLLNWNTHERTVVNMLSEEEEDLWNGVVGATFLTRRHILVLKSHSLEICTLLDSPQLRMADPSEMTGIRTKHKLPPTQMSAAVQSYFFPGTTFRGPSFSKPMTHTSVPEYGSVDADPATTTISLSFLAYDVLRGLFHCGVTVVIPSALDPADSQALLPPLDVKIRLLSSHNMALQLAPSTELSPRSGFSQGTRGFVSACALGRAGRRGVWVERRRGAVRRVVYGFTVHTNDEDDCDETTSGGLTTAAHTVDFQPGTQGSAAASRFEIESSRLGWNSQTPRAIEGKEIYDMTLPTSLSQKQLASSHWELAKAILECLADNIRGGCLDSAFTPEAQKAADELLGDGKFAPGYERAYGVHMASPSVATWYVAQAVHLGRVKA